MLIPLTCLKRVPTLIFSLNKHAEHRHTKACSQQMPHCCCSPQGTQPLLPPISNVLSSAKIVGAGFSSSGKAPVVKMIWRLKLKGGGDPPAAQLGCLLGGKKRKRGESSVGVEWACRKVYALKGWDWWVAMGMNAQLHDRPPPLLPAPSPTTCSPFLGVGAGKVHHHVDQD